MMSIAKDSDYKLAIDCKISLMFYVKWVYITWLSNRDLV